MMSDRELEAWIADKFQPYKRAWIHSRCNKELLEGLVFLLNTDSGKDQETNIENVVLEINRRLKLGRFKDPDDGVWLDDEKVNA